MQQIKNWVIPKNIQWHFSYKQSPPPTFAKQCNIAQLDQVHGANVIKATTAIQEIQKADALWTDDKTICSIRTADCVPILFTDLKGTYIGAIHAGWRGLAKKIITHTFTTLNRPPESWLVWIGPHIRQPAFEVQADMKNHFPKQVQAFKQIDAQHWLCNLETLVLAELKALGIQGHQVCTNTICTFSYPKSMYSYRRTPGLSQRHISQIWKKN